MIDTSKIKKILPDCEIGEIRPCTTPGKVQFHLMVSGKKKITAKIIDLPKLINLLEKDVGFENIKSSLELGVVKTIYRAADISILASGRVVVKKADNEKKAQEILEVLAPLLKQSIF